MKKYIYSLLFISLFHFNICVASSLSNDNKNITSSIDNKNQSSDFSINNKRETSIVYSLLTQVVGPFVLAGSCAYFIPNNWIAFLSKRKHTTTTKVVITFVGVFFLNNRIKHFLEPETKKGENKPGVEETIPEPETKKGENKPGVEETILNPETKKGENKPGIEETILEPETKKGENKPGVEETIPEPETKKGENKPGIEETIPEPETKKGEPGIAGPVDPKTDKVVDKKPVPDAPGKKDITLTIQAKLPTLNELSQQLNEVKSNAVHVASFLDIVLIFFLLIGVFYGSRSGIIAPLLVTIASSLLFIFSYQILNNLGVIGRYCSPILGDLWSFVIAILLFLSFLLIIIVLEKIVKYFLSCLILIGYLDSLLGAFMGAFLTALFLSGLIMVLEHFQMNISEKYTQHMLLYKGIRMLFIKFLATIDTYFPTISALLKEYGQSIATALNK